MKGTLEEKIQKLKEKYDRLNTIDMIMQSRDRVEERQRHRAMRIIDLKILILMNRQTEGKC